MRPTSLVIAILLASGCAQSSRRIVAPRRVLSGVELTSTGASPFAKTLAARSPDEILASRVDALRDDPPQEIIDKYGQVIRKCREAEVGYGIKQADALDKQNALKTLVGSATGIATAGGGTVGGVSDSKATSQAAGWTTLGISVVGTVLGYFLSPGEEGIKARNASVQTVSQLESDLKNKLSALDKDPAN